jgi:hypothetical protein
MIRMARLRPWLADEKDKKMVMDALSSHGDPVRLPWFCYRIRIDQETGCWMWIGGKDPDGYGIFSYVENKKHYSHRAHRLSYLWTFGNVPKELDHIVCDRESCVNPFHTVPTTTKANVLRSNNRCALNARKTHCPSGHPLSGPNLLMYRGGRHCRACDLARKRARYWRRKRGQG